MRSLVVIVVEHGDTTDPLDDFVRYATNIQPADAPLELLDWTARVDLDHADRDYTFRWNPATLMVNGLPSRDHHHVTFPGE